MPGRPTLTFDLDGVLCRPPFGINPGKGQHKSREGEGRRNALWLTERWRYAGRKPMPGAVDGFMALSCEYDCRIVSARSEQARGLTERWFAQYIGVVPTMHLRAGWVEKPAQFKARVVQQIKPFAHFEDDAHTAEWLAELVPAIFLVDWARNAWLDGANVHRIREIGEALPVLRALERLPANQPPE